MTEQRTIVSMHTEELSAQQIADVRELLWAAFADDEHGAFSENDWQHSIGGTHFMAVAGDEIVSHASVVDRTLYVDGVPVRTGYVEAVATTPHVQGRGHGTAVMRRVGDLIARDYELGALGTGSQGFYERLGWRIWRGLSSVRMPDGAELATPDDDGYIMVMLTTTSPPIDVGAPIKCEWRPGDAW